MLRALGRGGLQMFDQWRDNHKKTATDIRRHLEKMSAAPLEKSWAEDLRLLVEEARSQLWLLFHMRQMLIKSNSVLLFFSLEHMLPCERMYAWMGTLRPSDACNGLISKLQYDPNSSDGKGSMLRAIRVRRPPIPPPPPAV